jgi:hypothetical protein
MTGVFTTVTATGHRDQALSPREGQWNGSYIHCHGFHDMRKPWAMTVTLDS